MAFHFWGMRFPGTQEGGFLSQDSLLAPAKLTYSSLGDAGQGRLWGPL